jgi:hypothetical protein
VRLLNEKPAPWVEEPHTRLGVTEVAGDPSANIGPQNDNHQVQFALDFALDKELSLSTISDYFFRSLFSR